MFRPSAIGRALKTSSVRSVTQVSEVAKEIPVNVGQQTLGQTPPRTHRLIRDPDDLEAVAPQQSKRFRHLRQNLQLVLARSEEHTSELQSLRHLVCRLL